jgi:hypothetical protein
MDVLEKPSSAISRQATSYITTSKGAALRLRGQQELARHLMPKPSWHRRRRTMAEHAWTVLCQRTLVDSGTNLLSMIDVFDRLIVNQSSEIEDVERELEKVRSEGGRGIIFPARMQVVTQWFRSDSSQPETSRLRLSLADPSGDRLFEQEVSIELEQSLAQRITLGLDRIRVTTLGQYWWIVEKIHPAKKGKRESWVQVARIPLQVVAAPQAQES